MWKKIYDYLKEKGYDVYSPGQHKGDCLKPYVVIKPTLTYQLLNFSTDMCRFELLIYVPQNKFSSLEPFVAQIKHDMKKLPLVSETHMEVSGFNDDTNNSHMWSVQYEYPRKFYNH